MEYKNEDIEEIDCENCAYYNTDSPYYNCDGSKFNLDGTCSLYEKYEEG